VALGCVPPDARGPTVVTARHHSHGAGPGAAVAMVGVGVGEVVAHRHPN
jgi:hypothetical protein